jgi:lysozyme
MLAGSVSRRRTRRVVLAALAIIAAVGMIGPGVWFIWLPHYRPSLDAGERFGVDVSHHQGSIAWDRVAADGIEFVYINLTQRDDFVDPRFELNWREAGEAGLDRGAYHFFSLCASGAAQADQFLSWLPQDEDMLPPAVDLELLGTCGQRPDAETVMYELGVFLERVEKATGDTTLLYIGDDFAEAYPITESIDRPLWLISYLRRPAGEWAIWQVGGFAHVDGIEGRVDLDVMRS